MKKAIRNFLIVWAVLGTVVACVLMAKPADSLERQMVDTDRAQDLSNKTLIASILSGVFTGTYTLAGTPALTAPTIASPTFSGTVGGNYTLGSSKPCATGFTRITPNFCKPTGLSQQGYTEATSCTAHFIDGNMPGGSWVLLRFHWRALSINAIGERANNVFIYDAAGCGNLSTEVIISAREFAAVSAGTAFHKAESTVLVKATAGSFYSQDANTGGNGNADVDKFTIEGYFD